MAVVVWWLVRQTVNVKPWNAQHASEMASGTARCAALR